MNPHEHIDRKSGSRAAVRPLWRVGLRHLTRHPWQSILMMVGIALGVAVVVAVDLANVSASRAFDLSVDAVAGRATHRIVGGPQGIDEAAYTGLRQAGLVRAAAPVISAYVTSPQLGERPMQLLGVDPFAEPPFRSFLSAGETVSSRQITSLLTKPDTVLIASSVADQYQLEVGDRAVLEVAGRRRTVEIAGLLSPENSLGRRAVEGIIIADIATAQEITNRLGRLDHIDLILPEPGEDKAAEIESLLRRSAGDSAKLRVVPVDTRSGATRKMTASFRLNLAALSLLALVVGMFLIYNTMTFSVVQRRALFGMLRSLGVTRQEVFGAVLAEALIVGVVSSCVGLVLGILMGQWAVAAVSRTISDLYFVLTVRAARVPVISLVKGSLLGVCATVGAATLPAREAALASPRAALSRSGLEAKARRGALAAGVGGLASIGTGTVALFLPTRSLIVGFGATLLVVLGFALLTPVVTTTLMEVIRPWLGRVLGVLGRMATRDVSRSLSRTAVAVAALMVAMSVTIGVSLMIGSFRQTVIDWLGDALQGDIVVSAPRMSGLQDVTPFDPQAASIIEHHDAVRRVDLLRSASVDSSFGPVDVEAGNSLDYGAGLRYRSSVGSPRSTWAAVREGDAVIISEPLSNRLGLSTSDVLELYTDRGVQAFPIVGVYYDYASPTGTAIMSLSTYRSAWEDDTITALIVQLQDDADPDEVAQEMEQALAPVRQLIVRPNQTIRQAALAIFDRTFSITSALQVLATVVAFIGVLSALLALQLEKQREFGVLRAIGLTVPELRGLILLETSLMGSVAGLLSMPTGAALAMILIRVINQRSFGWTLQTTLAAGPFVQALSVSLLASLLAGLYPALQMASVAPADALRYE